jgi:hypothetical protein
MIDPQREVSFSSTIYRELYEELFGGAETQKDMRRLRPDWFFKVCQPLEWFEKHKGAYHLLCTCFGLNLVSGNYELGVLLAVTDENYWESFSHLLVTNWEVLDTLNPVVSSKDRDQLTSYMQRTQWTAGGLFTLVQGLERLRAIEQGRIVLPDIEHVNP